MGVKQAFISPYHPQSNGMLESKHQAFTDILSYITRSNPQNWDEKIDLACYILNTTYHSRIKNLPYTLHYKRDPNININELVNSENNHNNIDIEDLYRIARENIKLESNNTIKIA